MDAFFYVHPVLLAAIIGLVVAVGFFIAAHHARRRLWKVVDVIAGSIALIPVAFVALGFAFSLLDPRFRTYKAFYSEIEVGMTHDHVFELLDRHYPAGGARQRPTILEDSASTLDFFMNPEDFREPNCEGIFLRMKDGIVAEKRYSAD